jgi:hypothetical protein
LPDAPVLPEASLWLRCSDSVSVTALARLAAPFEPGDVRDEWCVLGISLREAD